jgi:putative ABC transport system permease protein
MNFFLRRYVNTVHQSNNVTEKELTTMPDLASRNLFHDKVRLIVTLTGIIFAVVLVAIQTGLFIGFSTTTSNLIDNSHADLWVMSKGVRYIDVGTPFPERKLYQVRSVPGIERAEKYIVFFTLWKKPDGGEENVEIVGFDPDNGFGGPWNLVQGSIHDVKPENNIIVDRFYTKKLDVERPGQIFEMLGHRARVVGFTSGIRTFTTSPLVFTSYKNALDFTGIPVDRTMFVLVKAKPGVPLDQLRRAILARVDAVDVYTTPEFSANTSNYWMFGTGAGVTVLIAAGLGLIVGIVVVAQTIYAATIDHIREYGTLKAMGATNGYIYRIILKQSLISALIGYAAGMSIALVVIRISQGGGPAIILPNTVKAGLFLLTLFMCTSAAIVSIRKVTSIDPAMVFKG